jgi:hypothetical protein
MRRMISATSLILATGSVNAIGQDKPNFSGKWVFDSAKSTQCPATSLTAVAANFGNAFTARQDAKTLLIERMNPDQTLATATYQLDGSESRNTTGGRSGQLGSESVSRCAWEGNKLVVKSTSTRAVRGEPTTIETTRVLWFDKDGSMVSELTSTPGGQVPKTVSVYRKQ